MNVCVCAYIHIYSVHVHNVRTLFIMCTIIVYLQKINTYIEEEVS